MCVCVYVCVLGLCIKEVLSNVHVAVMHNTLPNKRKRTTLGNDTMGNPEITVSEQGPASQGFYLASILN